MQVSIYKDAGYLPVTSVLASQFRSTIMVFMFVCMRLWRFIRSGHFLCVLEQYFSSYLHCTCNTLVKSIGIVWDTNRRDETLPAEIDYIALMSDRYTI
jgi:hypothetical protein